MSAEHPDKPSALAAAVLAAPSEMSLEELRRRKAARDAKREADSRKQADAEEHAYLLLEEQYGADDICRVETAGGMVVVKRNKDAYKRFRDQLWNDKTKSRAGEILARACLLHPSREAYDAMAERFPAIVDVVGGATAKFHGAVAEDEAKKS